MSTGSKKTSKSNMQSTKTKEPTLKDQLLESEKALLEAEEKTRKLESQLSKMKNANQEVEELRQDLEKLRAAKVADRKQIDKLLADVDQLKTDLAQSQKREKKLSDEKRGLEKELVDLQEKIHSSEMAEEEPVVESAASKFRIELYYREGAIPGRIEHIGSKSVCKFQLDEPGEMLRFLTEFSPVAPENGRKGVADAAPEKIEADVLPEPMEQPMENVASGESEEESRLRVNLKNIAHERKLYSDQPFTIEFQLEADSEIANQCEKGVREKTSIFAQSVGSKRSRQLIGMKSEESTLENPIVVHIPAAVLEPGLYRIDGKIDLTPEVTGETVHASKDCGLIYVF